MNLLIPAEIRDDGKINMKEGSSNGLDLGLQPDNVKGHPILTPNSVHLPLYVPPHRRSPPTKTG